MAKTARTKKNSSTMTAPAADSIVMQHAEVLDTTDQDLANLMSSLDAASAGVDEIVERADEGVDEIETAMTEVPAENDADLEAAMHSVAAVEASVAAATPDGVDEGAAPTGDACDIVQAAAAEPAKVKKTPTPRKHYTDKTERLRDKLGTELGDYMVLTMKDAEVDPAELEAKMEESLAIIRAMNKKEQNWAVKLIEFIAKKKTALPDVTTRMLTVLRDEGKITTGKDGNVIKNLLGKPYAMGSARAMSGNNLGMLKDLKLVLADGKGAYLPNPDSLLLASVNQMLFGAAPAATPAAA